MLIILIKIYKQTYKKW